MGAMIVGTETTHGFTVGKAVSYEEIFPRIFGVGGVKTFPWKISSGSQSEDLGPSLTIQEFFSRKYSGFYMQRIS